MKKVGWELKKLFCPTSFRYFVVILIAANFCLCLITVPEYDPAVDIQTYRERYISDISYTVRIAERNIQEYGSNGDNYTVRYQRQVSRMYSKLLEAKVIPERAVGWNEYFSFIYDDLLLMLFAILMGSAISTVEKDSGMETIIFIAKRGKFSGYNKILAMFIISASAVLCCTLSTVLAVAVKHGLSSPMVPLCSVVKFEYCPFNISVFDYIFISSVIKLLAIWGLAIMASWIAKLSGSYIVTLVSEGGAIGVGYFMSLKKMPSSMFLLNPYTFCTVDGLFERYRSVNIFGASVPLLTVCIVCLIVAVIVGAVLLCLSAQRLRSTVRFERAVKNRLQKWYDEFFYGIKYYQRHSLFYYEAKKHFISSKCIILCVIMLAVKLVCVVSAAPEKDLYETYYRDVCYELTGELTEEKTAYIGSELQKAEKIIDRQETMQAAAQNSEISLEEYNAYIRELNEAYVRRSAFLKISDQCERIKKAESRGFEGRILYDTGWLNFFGAGKDLILYLFLILFFCGSYSFEQKSGMMLFLRTACNGTKGVWKAKICLALVISIVSFAIFFGIDLIVLLNSYDLPNAAYSFASIVDTASGIPILVAAGLMTVFKLSLAVFISILTLLVSKITKHIYFVVPIMAVVVILVMM